MRWPMVKSTKCYHIKDNSTLGRDGPCAQICEMAIGLLKLITIIHKVFLKEGQNCEFDHFFVKNIFFIKTLLACHVLNLC
jgi:hypothetical protein